MSSVVGKPLKDDFDGGGGVTRGGTAGKKALPLWERLKESMFKAVPSNIETAAISFTAAIQDKDIVSLLNAKLTNKIRTGERVLLLVTIEVINGEAASNVFNYASGGVPTSDDTQRTFSTAAAIASEYIRGVWLFTDAKGNIRMGTADTVNVTAKVHLEGYQYALLDATS